MAGTQQQQQNSDNSLAMLWGLLLTFAVIGLFWFFFHNQITRFVLKVRLVESRVIASLVPQHRIWIAWLKALPAEQLGLSDLVAISHAIGWYLRFPISLLLLSFAWFIYSHRATLQFKKYYTMNTLVDVEKKNWPQISPVAQLDLVNTPIDQGAWAMGLTPLQFAKNNHLLQLERKIASTSSEAVSIGSNYIQAKLKRDAAKRILSIQLGPHWKSVEALPGYTKSLFAVFAARALSDKKGADELLTQLSQSASYGLNPTAHHPSVSLSEVMTNALLKKHQNHPLITAVIKQHAYVLGVMASMLVLARQGGVLPSADFLWLKPQDRALWFMLNCVGRKTAYAEVVGPFSHWVAECTLARQLRTPMVDTALDALESALKEVQLSDQLKEGDQ